MMASASDIITYIGIPLAVIGVLPIIYTCITSLINLRRIKDKIPAFCNAACVMELVREVCSREESTFAADMRECAQHWKKVKLG